MKKLEMYAAEAGEFIRACHRLAQNQYVTSSGGNLAWRLEDDLLLITPTKLYKGDINLQDLVFIDLKGKVMEGERKPRGETPMLVELLEMSSRSIMQALKVGNIKELNRQAVKDLSNTMQARGLPIFGAPRVNASLEDLYFGS